MKLLKAGGLVHVEQRTRKWGGKTSNLYRLRAPARYLRPSDSDRRAATDRCAKMAHRVPPSSGASRSAKGGVSSKPSLITPASSEEEPEGARNACPKFERVFAEWTSKGVGRTSWLPSLAEWQRCVAGVGPGRLEAAALCYLAEKGDARRGPKALQYWLKDQDFRATLDRGASAGTSEGASGGRFPDEVVRTQVVASDGEGFTRSYLDPATWDADARSVTPRGETAYRQLSKSAWLKSPTCTVTLVDPSGTRAPQGPRRPTTGLAWPTAPGTACRPRRVPPGGNNPVIGKGAPPAPRPRYHFGMK
jgi:hypothetical protein